MAHHPVARRGDHQCFCHTEKWSEVRNARGKTGHHVVYELTLPDARILRTRISHPIGRTTYGESMWSHILRDQIEVSAGEFWACVTEQVLPFRGAPDVPAGALPVSLVSQLISHGVDDAEVKAMSKAEAIARLSEIYSRPAEGQSE